MSVVVLLAAATAGCALPPGWEAIDAKRPRYIVFGEIHGTAEAPAMVGQIACALTKRRERVLVAVEQDAAKDAALQAAWTQPAAAFAAALPTALKWHGRLDGNGSVAIRDLLVDVHALKLSGRPIAVVAFNGVREPGQSLRFADLPGPGRHEAMQAENIRRAADAGHYDRVLILVGNLHASKAPVTRGGISYEPMAMRLAPAGEIVSLNMVGGEGTAWNCQVKPNVKIEPGKPLPPDALDCGAHPVPGLGDLGAAPRAGLGVPADRPWPFVHDGYIWLGASKASSPVAPEKLEAVKP